MSLEGVKMKKTVFGLSVLLVFGFVLAGCDNGTNGTTGNGYDGFGVWLVTESDYDTFDNVGSGQPRPVAIAHISSIGDSFTADFHVPENFNPDTSNEITDGWWNIGDTPTQWTVAPDNYFVLIFPYKIHPDNFEWIFDEGKISAPNSTVGTININANPFTFSLADFMDRK
jgi:predicted small secreted protein